jgi:hypothetical protein
MARCGALYACAGRDLEISNAFLDGALAAQIAVFVRLDGDAELVAKPS